MLETKIRSLPSSSRRRLLKALSTTIGTGLLPASAQGEGRLRTGSSDGHGSRDSESLRLFTPGEYSMVEELTETIIPSDGHSGGAKAAGVAQYVERVLAEGIDAEQKTLWREGLRLIDAMSVRECGKKFVEASQKERISILLILSGNEEMKDSLEVRFFDDLKRLTVDGYYTSKVGLLDELGYKGNTVLDEFVGCDDPGRR